MLTYSLIHQLLTYSSLTRLLIYLLTHLLITYLLQTPPHYFSNMRGYLVHQILVHHMPWMRNQGRRSFFLDDQYKYPQITPTKSPSILDADQHIEVNMASTRRSAAPCFRHHLFLLMVSLRLVRALLLITALRRAMGCNYRGMDCKAGDPRSLVL